MQVNRMTSNGLRGFQDAFSSMVDPQVQELHAGGEAAGNQEPAHRDQGEGMSPVDILSIFHRRLSVLALRD